MAEAGAAIEEAIAEVERLRRLLKKKTSPQVWSGDERILAKATASAWFQDHRSSVEQAQGGLDLSTVDDAYRAVLNASGRNSARSKYLAILKDLKHELTKLRTEQMTAKRPTLSTTDQPPDFTPLVSDPQMRTILAARWLECAVCVGAHASLAATVMMGGLLEAILVARINRAPDKKPLFTAKAAPMNPKTGKTRPLQEWMLKDFIHVLSELKWITVSASAAGTVLMDYRNYIHPQKQLSHNMHLTPDDAALFWEVTKAVTRQVVASAP